MMKTGNLQENSGENLREEMIVDFLPDFFENLFFTGRYPSGGIKNLAFFFFV